MQFNMSMDHVSHQTSIGNEWLLVIIVPKGWVIKVLAVVLNKIIISTRKQDLTWGDFSHTKPMDIDVTKLLWQSNDAGNPDANTTKAAGQYSMPWSINYQGLLMKDGCIGYSLEEAKWDELWRPLTCNLADHFVRVLPWSTTTSSTHHALAATDETIGGTPKMLQGHQKQRMGNVQDDDGTARTDRMALMMRRCNIYTPTSYWRHFIAQL
jgi:hypothetical protein